MADLPVGLLRRNHLSSSAVLTCFESAETYIVASLDGGTIHILSADGEPLRILPQPEDRSPALSLAIEDDHPFIGRRSGRLESWSLIDGTQQKSIQAHESSIRALISRNPEVLISSSRDSTIKIWNSLTFQCRSTLRSHSDVVIAIAPQANLLASASYDGTCRLWNIESGELLHIFLGLASKFRSIAFEGSIIVAGGVDGEIESWSVENGKSLGNLSRGHDSIVSRICIEKGIVVTAGADGMLKAWSVDRLEKLWEVKAHPNAVNSMEVQDGLIITGGSDDVVKIWNLQDGTLLKEFGVRLCAVWKVGVLKNGRVYQVYWNEGAVLDILEINQADAEAN